MKRLLPIQLRPTLDVIHSQQQVDIVPLQKGRVENAFDLMTKMEKN